MSSVLKFVVASLLSSVSVILLTLLAGALFLVNERLWLARKGDGIGAYAGGLSEGWVLALVFASLVLFGLLFRLFWRRL